MPNSADLDQRILELDGLRRAAEHRPAERQAYDAEIEELQRQQHALEIGAIKYSVQKRIRDDAIDAADNVVRLQPRAAGSGSSFEPPTAA